MVGRSRSWSRKTSGRRMLGTGSTIPRCLRPVPSGVGLDLAGRRKDGSQFPVEVSLSPVRSGGRSAHHLRRA